MGIRGSRSRSFGHLIHFIVVEVGVISRHVEILSFGSAFVKHERVPRNELAFPDAHGGEI